MGIKNFPYAYDVPIVGPEVVKLFSFVHKVTMIASNLEDAESAFQNGERLTGLKISSSVNFSNSTQNVNTYIYHVPN